MTTCELLRAMFSRIEPDLDWRLEVLDHREGHLPIFIQSREVMKAHRLALSSSLPLVLVE
ncbi:MAG: hypothetical protein JWR89_5121 [Tardiphaga sp.]|nr:hypothetical protein [Tardiphaga sp.]